MTVSHDTVQRYWQVAYGDARSHWPLDAEQTRAALTAVEPDIAADMRRAVADEVEDALGDQEGLPPEVAARMADLIHRLRTGRDL